MRFAFKLQLLTPVFIYAAVLGVLLYFAPIEVTKLGAYVLAVTAYGIGLLEFNTRSTDDE